MANENKKSHPAGAALEAKNDKSKRSTKLQRIIDLLTNRPQGLNRFESETHGEHCLNSTVAVIRKMYGSRLFQQWEVVPTRYNSDGVRVVRYWLTGGANG